MRFAAATRAGRGAEQPTLKAVERSLGLRP